MEQWIEQYAAGPAKLREAVSGLSPQLMTFVPSPGAWSIHEIAVHVCDTEIVAVHRMKKAIAESNPLVLGFDQDEWARRLDYKSEDLELNLAVMESLRAAMTETLRRVKPEDWERTVVHNEAGKLTLRDLLIKFVTHVDVHLKQIERNKSLYAAGG
ncbi:DinB family protein [Paenibacillus thermoaerophilus]|uniref:DinB family protein n=1 Tax=Paenibacillus thermoaerophilus TaxID=1215385 RepID=A0ABW2V7C6_9BACL|nr:DinB family protein [Paenibacillus thermoaerophilus]TMV17141.1 DUF664 domain-containing protein [Paenibacillus thermoaerophilus]